MVVNPFIWLIHTVLNLAWWAIFIWFVLSLLIQFNVINRYNPYVNRVYAALDGLIDPLLSRIRKYIPVVGGIDLSPLVLILGIQFLQRLVLHYGGALLS